MPATPWPCETESSEALSRLAAVSTFESPVESYVRDDEPEGLALSEFEPKKHDWFDEPFTRVLCRRLDASAGDAAEGAAQRRR